MTDAIHEQVSAFVDGELAAAESELLLKRVERDGELRARVGRYVLAGEALRATRAQGPSRAFAANIAAAIESESASTLMGSRAIQWLKPIAGGAIAAGVAAIALVAIQLSPTEGALTADSSIQQPGAEQAHVSQIVTQPIDGVALVGGTQPNSRFTNDSGASYVVPVPGIHHPASPIQIINSGRLANYVVAHSEYSSPLGRRNVLTGLLAEEAAGADASSEIGDAATEAFSIPAGGAPEVNSQRNPLGAPQQRNR